jgi:transcriptional regulator with XRE-family HTH domain
VETPAETIARNLAELRDRRRYSVRQLSERLKDLQHPILPSGVSKIENLERKVSAEDLVALALALDVSPTRLLLPSEAVDEVELTPAVRAPWASAWSWATGQRPLAADDEPVDAAAVTQFEQENQPHRAKARSREVLLWDDQLGPLRTVLQQLTNVDGVPPQVIRTFVDFWAANRRAPKRMMGKGKRRNASR